LTAQPPRRHSIFTALLLILVGAIFLLDQFYPGFRLGHLIRLYWPVLIILWGVAKLLDHLAAREGQTRAPLLSGAEAALLVILAFVLVGFVVRDWVQGHFPDVDVNFPPFHQSYSRSQELPPQVIPAGAHVEVDTLRGNITIEAGNDLRVSGTESSWGRTESAADERMRQVNIVVEKTTNGYRIHPEHQDNFEARVGVDLDLQVPKTVSIVADTNRGNVRVTGISGRIDTHSGNGDIDIRGAGSDVNAALQDGDARITDVRGNVHVTGRGNDVEVSNVSGDAAVNGAFIEATRLRDVAKTTRCTSPWSDVTVDQLTGRMDLDEGDIQIANAGGDAKIVSHNKDIELEAIEGRLDVSNAHGDIKIDYSTPPRNPVSVWNDSGDVELTLPSRSNFQISAISRSGDIKNDFDTPSLQLVNQEGNGKLNGRFGTGGPMISVTTSYGTIHLNKSD
jgi:DUF4097 and DUF4098 domain-containing protein YvlB